MTYDLAIIGGGPAGAAAAVYAARKQLRAVMITKDWLGQSYDSVGIENWIGTVNITGLELSKLFEKHAKAYAKDIIDFKEGEIVTQIQNSTPSTEATEVKKIKNQNEKTAAGFVITTDKGNTVNARTILITSGSHRRKLEIPGAEKFENKGVTYCASCDGPVFAGQDVVVIGGGNAGFESAAQLLAYCKSVTLLNRSDQFKADPGTMEAVRKDPKMKIITSAVPKEIKGDKFVSGLVYTDTKANTDHELAISGIFVEIGSLPNTDFSKDVVKLDAFNRIIVDPKNQRATTAGIWAAGDCTDGLYHQNNIAAGDAVKALEDIYIFVKAGK